MIEKTLINNKNTLLTVGGIRELNTVARKKSKKNNKKSFPFIMFLFVNYS